MICEHLRPLFDELEDALIAKQGVKNDNPPFDIRRYWSFHCVLQLKPLRSRLGLPDFVVDDIHQGTHDGEWQGFVCERHDSGLYGHHPAYGRDYPRIR